MYSDRQYGVSCLETFRSAVCPHCGAQPGSFCKRPNGKVIIGVASMHAARFKAAATAAAIEWNRVVVAAQQEAHISAGGTR